MMVAEAEAVSFTLEKNTIDCIAVNKDSIFACC